MAARGLISSDIAKNYTPTTHIYNPKYIFSKFIASNQMIKYTLLTIKKEEKVPCKNIKINFKLFARYLITRILNFSPI